MKSLRFLVSFAVLLALAAGYLGSQYFWFNGKAPEWTLLMDSPVVVVSALLLLVGAIALSFAPKEKT